jgi:hypothetical protein
MSAAMTLMFAHLGVTAARICWGRFRQEGGGRKQVAHLKDLLEIEGVQIIWWWLWVIGW